MRSADESRGGTHSSAGMGARLRGSDCGWEGSLRRGSSSPLLALPGGCRGGEPPGLVLRGGRREPDQEGETPAAPGTHARDSGQAAGVQGGPGSLGMASGLARIAILQDRGASGQVLLVSAAAPPSSQAPRWGWAPLWVVAGGPLPAWGVGPPRLQVASHSRACAVRSGTVTSDCCDH